MQQQSKDAYPNEKKGDLKRAEGFALHEPKRVLSVLKEGRVRCVREVWDIYRERVWASSALVACWCWSWTQKSKVNFFTIY